MKTSIAIAAVAVIAALALAREAPTRPTGGVTEVPKSAPAKRLWTQGAGLRA